jgi:ATP-binding cassette subfamily B protein
MGTHSELLRKGGKYYQLYTRQFRHQMAQVLDPYQEEPSLTES